LKEAKKIYIETYGCQMNFSDSEIVASLMQDEGYEICVKSDEADVVFVNTCSIRDNAEQRVHRRLRELSSLKKKNPFVKIGVLGCMAERLKQQLLEEEETVDMIVGPDAYRDLPALLDQVENGQKAINVILSTSETYADITPVRLNKNGITAFISIMRGCENFCAYCVVPFTRGKERSRDPQSILSEAKALFADGYREVTLLGQNVNSYSWEENGRQINFASLLEQVAEVNPLLRLRFATSHPKDISDELLKAIGKHHNICNAIHLPVQSGSSSILKLMKRNYTRKWYLDRIAAIKKYVPDCAVSTDVITGFCSETEQDHQQTISLMREVGFDYAFMFKYSERPDTLAQKKLKDDVREDVKSARLKEIIDLQQQLSHESNKKDIGKTFEVLVEGTSKKSEEFLMGRNSRNKVVVFPKETYAKGDYVHVKINGCTTATLIGKANPLF
jgi:tRNA-2-methylthio-N6-dimethylallyladenosine synthase